MEGRDEWLTRRNIEVDNVNEIYLQNEKGRIREQNKEREGMRETRGFRKGEIRGKIGIGNRNRESALEPERRREQERMIKKKEKKIMQGENDT